MRGLTKRERREIVKELKNAGFEMSRLRVVIDYYDYMDVRIVGLNCMDKNSMQRICVPFKSDPDMAKIEKQMENIANEVFIKEDTWLEQKPELQRPKKQ